MLPSCSSFSFLTASTTSPFNTVVLFHSGSLSVDETTYFGIVLNLSAKSPSRDGHAAANPSYVLRPSSSALESVVSSSLNLSPSPRSISNVQPPYLKSSAPPGSSMTPSSETNSVTMILAISVSFSSNAAKTRRQGKTHRRSQRRALARQQDDV